MLSSNHHYIVVLFVISGTNVARSHWFVTMPTSVLTAILLKDKSKKENVFFKKKGVKCLWVKRKPKYDGIIFIQIVANINNRILIFFFFWGKKVWILVLSFSLFWTWLCKFVSILCMVCFNCLFNIDLYWSPLRLWQSGDLFICRNSVIE